MAISLTFRSVVFDYSFSLSGKDVSFGSILDLAVDGRSMFLFEGTASGPFPIRGYGAADAIIMTITPDASGKFSAIIPFSTSCLAGRNRPQLYKNPELLTVTKFPDYFEIRTSMDHFFAGCSNLSSICKIPGEQNKTYYNQAFAYSGLTEAPDIDLSNATNLTNMFAGCTNLVTVPLYNTSKVTNFSSMFSGCSSLVSVPCFDTSSATDMQSMFYGCTKLASSPVFDTSHVTTVYRMYAGCSSLRHLPEIDLSSVEDLRNFASGSGIVEIPSSYDYSSVTNANSAFATCNKLRSFPDLYMPKLINGAAMFEYCKQALETGGKCDFPVVTTLAGMFYQCNNLVSVESISAPSVSTIQRCFTACRKLKKNPFEYLACTNYTLAFEGCLSLQETPIFDYINAVRIWNPFLGTNLKEITYIDAPNCLYYKGAAYTGALERLEGINMAGWRAEMGHPICEKLLDLKVSNYDAAAFELVNIPTLTWIGSLDALCDDFDLSYCPNLTHDSLVSIIASIASVEGKTLTLGTTNLEKLSEEEKNVATDKGWTLN